MKESHLQHLQPICPICLQNLESIHSITLSQILKGSSTQVEEGLLQCTNLQCLSEFPILDGMPLLLPNLRTYVSDNIMNIQARQDRDALMESLLGDCCGPNTGFDMSRQHLSNYAWGHYGDLDPDEPDSTLPPGSVVNLLERGLELAGDIPPGPLLDVGCAVGRTSFALAERYQRSVLGIDINFPMVQLASQVLSTGRVRYARRRVGVVYDRREFPVTWNHADWVDFWICDATMLPFTPHTFALLVALNVLDCMQSPYHLLTALQQHLKPGGKAILAVPYDWSPHATPFESWIGGHSQRSLQQGSSASILRSLFTPGAHPMALSQLRILAEDELNWYVRVHDRSTVQYQTHLIVIQHD